MDGFPFTVNVIYRARTKSAEITIEDEVVNVIVPNSLSDTQIRRLITKRLAWIKKTMVAQAKAGKPKVIEYVNGESFPYLGKNYRLKIVNGEEPAAKLKSGYLWVTASNTEGMKEAIKQWYFRLAEKRLIEKTDRFSNILGVSPRSVSIKDFKTKWGSCSKNGDIAYNWKIIMASNNLVDYVVIHELCHLKELNHSARFWKLLDRHKPDWRECKELLRRKPILG
ncbi:M48 family metallopeptidase [Gammaproteobacteria bacterium]|nr:M48 family metallopeptidase [Gammaproteobacteria bacterium]